MSCRGFVCSVVYDVFVIRVREREREYQKCCFDDSSSSLLLLNSLCEEIIFNLALELKSFFLFFWFDECYF